MSTIMKIKFLHNGYISKINIFSNAVFKKTVNVLERFLRFGKLNRKFMLYVGLL